VWESLVIHVFREHEIVGSNPTILTYRSGDAEWSGVGLLNRTKKVQFLPPELGDRLTVGRLSLKQAVKVQILLPEL
jgi:hypothetical protein